MTIVIVGAKGRTSEEDKVIVNQLIETASNNFPAAVFVTMLTQEGIGMFVKEKCLEKDQRGNFKFPFVELSMKIYAKFLPKMDVATYYLSRNATLFELGDAFVYLADSDRKGMAEDLIENRVKPSGRPYIILLPGEEPKLPI